MKPNCNLEEILQANNSLNFGFQHGRNYMNDQIGEFKVTITFKISADCEFSEDEFSSQFSPRNRKSVVEELAKSQILKRMSSWVNDFTYVDEHFKIRLVKLERKSHQRRESIGVSVKRKD